MNDEQLKQRIVTHLVSAEVDVRDLTGTSDHFEARVVSPKFEGRTMVEQHQLVYECLSDVLKTGELHALALKTYTPAQWEKTKR